MPYAPGSGAKAGNNVIFLLPDSIGFKMKGVVLDERYARNANGNLSHSRKELLLRPIKDDCSALPAPVVASCQDQLWIVDKLPDVHLWSEKAQVAMIEHNSKLAGPSSAAAGSMPEAQQPVSSDPAVCTTEADSTSQQPSKMDDAAAHFDFTQKDLAIALGVSPARVSQLIKIGMPPHSISAAKEWRIEQHRAIDEPLEATVSAVNASPAVEQTSASNEAKPLSDSLVDLVALKKPITREYLESLTTLELRALCQPRGLKVCGYKNDLVCRLIGFFANNSRISGNRAQIEALSLQDLQRVCREQGLPSSGSREDIAMKLMEPVSTLPVKHGRDLDVDDSRPSNGLTASCSESSSGPHSRAEISDSKDVDGVSSQSSVLPTEPLKAASSKRTASEATSLLASSERISRSLTKTAPRSTAMPSSDSGDVHASLHQRTAQRHPSASLHKKVLQAQPSAQLSQPRPQFASLDLYFPVPSAISSVTAPILLDNYPPPPDSESAPFTLIEKCAKSSVQPFPLFVLPQPQRFYANTCVTQRPPPGLGLSSYFQRVSGLATSTCKLCGIFVPEGSRAHHLRSKHPEFVTANASMTGEDIGFVAASASKFDRTITPIRLSPEIVQMLSGLNKPT